MLNTESQIILDKFLNRGYDPSQWLREWQGQDLYTIIERDPTSSLTTLSVRVADNQFMIRGVQIIDNELRQFIRTFGEVAAVKFLAYFLYHNYLPPILDSSFFYELYLAFLKLLDNGFLYLPRMIFVRSDYERFGLNARYPERMSYFYGVPRNIIFNVLGTNSFNNSLTLFVVTCINLLVQFKDSRLNDIRVPIMGQMEWTRSPSVNWTHSEAINSEDLPRHRPSTNTYHGRGYLQLSGNQSDWLNSLRDSLRTLGDAHLPTKQIPKQKHKTIPLLFLEGVKLFE